MVFVFIVGLGVREDVRAGAFAFVIFSLFFVGGLVFGTNEAKHVRFFQSTITFTFLYMLTVFRALPLSLSLSFSLSLYLSLSL